VVGFDPGKSAAGRPAQWPPPNGKLFEEVGNLDVDPIDRGYARCGTVLGVEAVTGLLPA
jgi:hypothetical protein